MSKITRFDVYGSAEYSAKGSLVLYDHHKEVVEDLERQLKEDRRDHLKDTRVLLKQLEELDKDNRALLDSNLELIKKLENLETAFFNYDSNGGESQNGEWEKRKEDWAKFWNYLENYKATMTQEECNI